MSSKDNSFNEEIKAKRNADYLAMIDKSMAEAKAGGFIPKTIDELEIDENASHVNAE